MQKASLNKKKNPVAYCFGEKIVQNAFFSNIKFPLTLENDET